ncbi:MAG: class I SAM-dependent methyltransferase [Chloroflexi bacterium]|nr:MAG: class I SAM-dependent methyltransferase [Chloroflexota bacterium]
MLDAPQNTPESDPHKLVTAKGRRLAWVEKLCRKNLRLCLRLLPARFIFYLIYHRNIWQGAESRSGTGSDLHRTEKLRAILPGIVRELDAKSFLDIPCGDFNWMQAVDLGVDLYIGGDILRVIVEHNRRQYANEWRRFAVLDITSSPLPQVDIVFCRDLFIHLSNADVLRALENVKRSQSQYLITTTFPSQPHNTDIPTGLYRAINLERPPFALPPPLQVIAEESFAELPDRSLGIWKISDL